MKASKKNTIVETPNMETPIIETPTLETSTTTPQEIMVDTIIEQMETPTTPSKGRDYNRPPFKSEMFYDLSTVNFPIQWTNPSNEEIITYENKFGDMKKGDMISFELNPNNVNTMGVGKVLGFKIQTNGFWIRYEAFNKKPYWKNLNLFKALSTETEIEQFNEARTGFFKALEEAKSSTPETETK